ncbi:MAG: hypothetical protein IPI23_10840 [Bacteroidetes bacterium]|nr:hypothetical protein [Bacteroidota bacterium]
MLKSGINYATLLMCILAFSQQAIGQTLMLAPSNYHRFNTSCADLAEGSINMTITGSVTANVTGGVSLCLFINLI